MDRYSIRFMEFTQFRYIITHLVCYSLASISDNFMAQIETMQIDLEIVSCIDKGFATFGQAVASVVYWKFQFATKLTKADAARRPDLLSNAIREIFKDGAPVIEDAIILQLRNKFHIVDRRYNGLEDAISTIRLSHSL
jgi:hypothetical protein